MSDKGSKGLREDTAGDAVAEILEKNGWSIQYRTLIPDEIEMIKSELIIYILLINGLFKM